MKRFGKWIAYFAIFIAMIIFFAPKTNLYYKAEASAQPYGVVLSGERPDDRGFAFDLENAKLYYEDLLVAELGRVSVAPWLLFNRVRIDAFVWSEEMERFVSGSVDHVTVQYSVFNPLNVMIEGRGDLGDFNGSLNVSERTVTIDLLPSATLVGSKPFWLKEMKKRAEGVYRYESNY